MIVTERERHFCDRFGDDKKGVVVLTRTDVNVVRKIKREGDYKLPEV